MVSLDTSNAWFYNRAQMGKPIKQALVAVGGRGSRLERPLSESIPKSMIRFGGRPALYWTLKNMRVAGIKRVVLAGESKRLLIDARKIAISAGFRLSQITVFTDQGAGVHGIPVQAEDQLDARFIFDAGHSMCPPGHYARLRSVSAAANVYSVFREDEANGSRARLREILDPSESRRMQLGVVGLPYALGTGWLGLARNSNFDIKSVLASDVRLGGATFVSADFEPEFDIPLERERTKKQFYQIFRARIALSLYGRLPFTDHSRARHAAEPIA